MDFSSGFGPKVSQCEAIIGYCFNSKVLCAEALNAAAFYLCSIWVQRGLDKHCWTMLRHDLISNENPARVGMEHGLDTCINKCG
ncbi:hypothetical protein FOXG_22704 [Fusarium oxysporum f. sp. lycopersici 4287]|uniref:Uncharacterized protein n=1 Tax=Fusarium oxysporum f. sp. lycopersici (strain 4287 / CBS 123668 / FGSC 9935 / NRRL 34936) TaxID=426428 RepID=A0A0J9WBS0_FUSO4|nr:hypothetical protein FOXG_22704 [Fusarium oxysporum f. sp. lycopersici 4287]EWZ78165.1 hypothetical protein FOWG_17518 [Fusarium oxysporum f. sp. lycopersici MN25]KAJ9413693.1 hypothetical protein QL093DRAFT_1110482 [Fusarium oxysporum]KNB19980.1 hypothetical protein FOXG_22704 [Fusarium oxysporum f. sp. lycopersici 4287]